MDKPIKIGIVIQARMGSNRLPGKILLPLPYSSNHSLIGTILNRTKIQNNNTFDFHQIVATSKNSENDELVNYLKMKFPNVIIFRGDEENVLSRFIEIQGKYDFDHVIRLTADNPCIHKNEIIETTQIHIKQANDYTYSSNYPIGTNVEICKGNIFKDLDLNSLTNSEKEHVTLFIRKNSKYKINDSSSESTKKYPEIRLTVDEKYDYLTMCAIFSKFDDIYFSLDEIVELYKGEKWIFEINHNINQKQV